MVIGVLLSGGTGSRTGRDRPKQYIEVNGRPMLLDAFDALAGCKLVDSVVIVASHEWRGYIDNNLAKCSGILKFIGYANPGETRQLSIYNALKYIEEKCGFNHQMSLSEKEDSLVIIHDAARPYVTSEHIESYVRACEKADGILPVLRPKDTVYMSIDGKSVHSLLDRNTLYLGQAPEVFNYCKYLDANNQIPMEKMLTISGSTQVAIMCNLNVELVDGDEKNVKITTAEDLEKYIESKKG